ncbi:MAG: tetratricopeptide repeat protein [Myxococcales bacterium]
MGGVGVTTADSKGAERTVSQGGKAVLWLGASEAPLALVTHLRSRGIALATLSTQEPPVARLMLVEPAVSPAARTANLKGRRVAVIHPDPGSADALAQALRGRGAQVVALSLNPESLQRVEALDPDAVLMEVTDFYGACWEIVRALWQHPRLKYAPVLLATPEGVASYAQGTPDVPSLCLAVQTVSEDYARIERASQGESPFELELAQLGPAKLLRVLTESGRGLRATLQCPTADFELDVAEGIIVGAQGNAKGAANDLYLGVHALALLMSQERGQVQVRVANHPAATNVMAPLDAALDAAREAKAAAPVDVAATREVASRMSLPGTPAGSPGPGVVIKPNPAAAKPLAAKAVGAFEPARPPKRAEAAKPATPATPARTNEATKPAEPAKALEPSKPAPIVNAAPKVDAVVTVPAPAPSAEPERPSEPAQAAEEPGPNDHKTVEFAAVDEEPKRAPPEPVNLAQPKKTLHGLPPPRRTTSTGRIMAVVPREGESLDAVAPSPMAGGARMTPQQTALAQVRATLKAQADGNVLNGEANGLSTQSAAAPRLDALASELPLEDSRVTSSRNVGRAAQDSEALTASLASGVSRVSELEAPDADDVMELGAMKRPLGINLQRWHVWAALGVLGLTLAGAVGLSLLRSEAGAPAAVSAPPALPATTAKLAPSELAGAPKADDLSAAQPAPTAAPAQLGSSAQAQAEDPQAADGAEEEDEDGSATGSALAPNRQASALVSQGHNFRKRKHYAQAKARYQAALSLLPGYPRALAGLAQLAIAQNRGKEAVGFAQKLVQARPGQGAYQLMLGDAYRSAGMMKEAQQAWQAAVRAGSSDAKARLKATPAPTPATAKAGTAAKPAAATAPATAKPTTAAPAAAKPATAAAKPATTPTTKGPASAR